MACPRRWLTEPSWVSARMQEDQIQTLYHIQGLKVSKDLRFAMSKMLSNSLVILVSWALLNFSIFLYK